MSWIDLVDNPAGMRASYRDAVPQLATFPPEPPPKWAKQSFNTVQLELEAIDVSHLQIAGASTEMIADIEVREDRGGLSVTVSSPTVLVSANTQFIHISRISAYQNGP